jgi:hypothetical protein
MFIQGGSAKRIDADSPRSGIGRYDRGLERAQAARAGPA